MLRDRPWLLIVFAFAALVAASAALIVVAVKNQPEELPLKHNGR